MNKSFLLVLIVCSSFELSFAKKEKSSKKSAETQQAVEVALTMPTLIIKSILNYTPYDLVLIDRSNNGHFNLPAGRGSAYSYVIENYRNVVINGSMRDCVMTQGQFVIESKNLSDDVVGVQQYYLNFCAVPGGVNDGSGFITGALGTIAFKFFMVGSASGCTMSTSCVKESEDNTVEICLELYVDERDINNKNFEISANCSPLTDKK